MREAFIKVRHSLEPPFVPHGAVMAGSTIDVTDGWTPSQNCVTFR
jgi:hypothetical protein